MPNTAISPILLINATDNPLGTEGFEASMGERTVCTFSDGSIGHLLNDVDDRERFRLMRSDDDGASWTEVENFTVTYTHSATWYDTPMPFSMTVDDDDHIHIVWGRNATQVRYVKLTKGGGWDWTKGTEEIAFTAGAGTVVRLDLEVLDLGVIAVGGLNQVSTAYNLLHCCRHSGGSWAALQTQSLASLYPVADFPYGGAIRVCRDTTGQTGGGDQRWVILHQPWASYMGLTGIETDLSTGLPNITKSINTNVMSFIYGTSVGDTAIEVSPGGDGLWNVSGMNGTTWYVGRFSWDGAVFPIAKNTQPDHIIYHLGLAARRRYSILMCEDRAVLSWSRTLTSGTNRIGRQIARIGTGSVGFGGFWAAGDSAGDYIVRDFFSGTNRNNNLLKFPAIFNSWPDASALGFRYCIGNTAPAASSSFTLLGPANGSTVDTDRPLIEVYLEGSNGGQGVTWANQARTKASLRIATNGTYTNDLREFDFNDSQFGWNTNYKAQTVPAGLKLFQGSSWRAQLRWVDEFGVYGPWGDEGLFTVAHPPTSTSHYPALGRIVGYSASGITFTWAFTDTWSGDSQTAYRIQVERVSDSAVLVDTGKVVSSATNADVVIAGSEIGVPLRWKIKLWDEDDAEGDWSDYFTFQMNAIPSVVMTNAPGYQSPAPTITWTYTPGTAGAQKSYRVAIAVQATNELVYDSGFVAGADVSHTPPGPVLQRNETYVTAIQVKDDAGLVGSTLDANRLASWTGPPQPAFSVITDDFYANGYNKIAWVGNVDLDANFASWRVYRRTEENATWTLVGESTSTAATVNLIDFLCPSGIEVEYVVVQVKVLAGAYVESDYAVTSTILVESDSYWVVDEESQGITEAEYLAQTDVVTFRIAHVTADSLEEEFEVATKNIIGKGRRRETGTRYGYKGTLTASLLGLGGMTPRQERIFLEKIRKDNRSTFLRNPFGDVFRAGIGGLKFDRIAGVGTSEYNEVTIPYEELSLDVRS